jgi:hypothetical protein
MRAPDANGAKGGFLTGDPYAYTKRGVNRGVPDACGGRQRQGRSDLDTGALRIN